MAADQAAAKDQAAEPVIARYVRTIIQPGGMNIDWPKIRAAAAIIAGLSAIHGLKYRKWQYVHTFGGVLGMVAAGAAILQKKYGQAPRPAEDE